MPLPCAATPPFAIAPPDEPRLTAYDEGHLVTYLRLIDADNEGADWQEAVRLIFGIDPKTDARAARIHASHLARARWIAAAGYVDLLAPRA